MPYSRSARTHRRTHTPLRWTRRLSRAPRRSTSARVETSAGGIVVAHLGEPSAQLQAALIGRIDRRGQMRWSLPKGHVEDGESLEQTAIREVKEETGLHAQILKSLGSSTYKFREDGVLIRKTVHYFLMNYVSGQLSDADSEVDKVVWIPFEVLPHRLTHADERLMVKRARVAIPAAVKSRLE